MKVWISIARFVSMNLGNSFDVVQIHFDLHSALLTAQAHLDNRDFECLGASVCEAELS